MTKDFPTFDCDAHVTEPPLIWERAKDFLTRDELGALKRTIWWDADSRLLIVNGRPEVGARLAAQGASDQTAETANRLIDKAPPSGRDHSANAGRASHGRTCPRAGLKSPFLNQARSDCRDPSLALAERISARVYGVIAEDEVVIVRNG